MGDGEGDLDHLARITAVEDFVVGQAVHQSQSNGGCVPPSLLRALRTKHFMRDAFMENDFSTLQSLGLEACGPHTPPAGASCRRGHKRPQAQHVVLSRASKTERRAHLNTRCPFEPSTPIRDKRWTHSMRGIW